MFSVDMLEMSSYLSYQVPFWIQVLITALGITTMLTAAIIHHRLRIFLKRHSGRPVNRMIQFYSLIQNLTIPPALFHSLTGLWYRHPGLNLYPRFMCHFFIVDTTFVLTFIQSFSFFMSFYRYSCIIQADFMTNWNITPKVFGDIVTGIHFCMSLVCSFFVVYGSQSRHLVMCEGQVEVFYDFDYFGKGGQSVNQTPCIVDDDSENILMKWSCILSCIAIAILSCNLIEIFFIARTLFHIRNQTESSTLMLSSQAFKNRKRDDGIVIAITMWQWIIEFFFNIFMAVFIFSILEGNRSIDYLGFMLIINVMYVILPAFYFLADQSFRIALREKGLTKALWSACRQNYD